MERVPTDVWLQHILPHIPPILYVVLRRVLPLFARRPDLFPSSAAFCMRAVKLALAFGGGSDARIVAQGIERGWLHLTGGSLLAVLQGDPLERDQDVDCGVLDTTTWPFAPTRWALIACSLVTSRL